MKRGGGYRELKFTGLACGSVDSLVLAGRRICIDVKIRINEHVVCCRRTINVINFTVSGTETGVSRNVWTRIFRVHTVDFCFFFVVVISVGRLHDAEHSGMSSISSDCRRKTAAV